MPMKNPAIYILANKKHGTLYVGVTSDIIKRIYQHKNSILKGFSSKYDCKILVYFEFHDNIESAITREKQIKGGSRIKKIALIESINPEWDDLYEGLL
jgi:putative endonuclease